MKSSFKNALGYALLYTFVMVAVTAIPLYAYIMLLMDHAQLQQEQELKEHAYEMQRAIGAIPAGSSMFVYPRSLLFRTALFDGAGEVIFSLLEEGERVVLGEGVAKIEGRLSYRMNLPENALGATSLVVSRKLSYTEVWLDGVMLVGIVALFVFAFSLLILSRSIQPFEEAARQMDRFFKDAMHELKTPLGVIRLNLEMLSEQFGQQRPIVRANSALTALSTVYGDIEYLIKHKRVEYRPEEFCASEALAGRIDFFADMISIKHLRVHTEIAPEIRLLMNRQEWERVVDNTLSNAIKYTPAKGEIWVRLEKNEGKALLSIKDTGVGISDTKAIFARYYRGDAIKGGFGIGLSIVKEICEKNGIGLNVVSCVGEGSCFTYAFSLYEAPCLDT